MDFSEFEVRGSLFLGTLMEWNDNNIDVTEHCFIQ